MAAKEEPQAQMSYIEMSHVCNECGEKEDCEMACKNGACKLTQKP